MSPAEAVRVVDAVLKDLQDRSGFDHWWDDISDDVQEEVRADLIEAVMPFGGEGA